MPGKFNYEPRHKYPHLIGEDTEVWHRFILLYPNKFDTVDYDVHIGKGVNTEPIPESSSRKYWADLTKKRIDVVAWKDNFVTIIEVKKKEYPSQPLDKSSGTNFFISGNIPNYQLQVLS